VSKYSQNHSLQAVLWVLAGTAIFSIIFASAKLFNATDWVWQIIFLRYLSGFIVMVLLAKFKHRPIAFSLAWPQHLARAVAGSLGGFAAIYAAANMAVSDAAAIGLLDSVFAVLLGIAIFHERIHLHRWYAIAGCAIGAFLVLFEKGAFQGNDSLGIPALVALAGAVFLAVESVFIRTVAMRENSTAVLLQVNFFGALLFVIPAAMTWNETSLLLKLSLCTLGPLALLGQYCNIRGYRIAPLSVVAPVGYSWILFGLCIDYWLFDQQLSAYSLAGAGVILFSGYLLASSRSKY
jgi:drug/metabolite transporter (DMT)-like permease